MARLSQIEELSRRYGRLGLLTRADVVMPYFMGGLMGLLDAPAVCRAWTPKSIVRALELAIEFAEKEQNSKRKDQYGRVDEGGVAGAGDVDSRA